MTASRGAGDCFRGQWLYRLATMTTRRTVELVGVRDLSPWVRSFSWRCADRDALEYIAGQWVNFYVPVAGEPLRRAYSIASAPDPARRDHFDIAVTRVRGGPASSALHALEPGARLDVDGAHGFFTRESAATEPALFVATGTGVCPIHAMIEDALRAPTGPPLTLLFGCREEADVLYRDDFDRWAAADSRFSWHVTLSRPSASWTGRRGYVQDHLADCVAPPQPHVYVCGLQRMIREVRRALKQDLGFDRRMIHSERYD